MRFLILWCLAAIATTGSLFAATAGDLTADVRLLIAQADSTTGKTDFSDATIRQALNLSQGAIAPMVGGVEWDTTFRAVNDRVVYPLGTNVMGIEGVWLVNKATTYNRIEYKRGREFGTARDTLQSHAANQKTFLEYKFNRGELTVFPNLTGMTPADSIRVDLYRYPASLSSDSSTFQLPEYTRLAVAKLAEYILRNNDFGIGEEGAGFANIETLAKMFIERYARRGYGGQAQ